MLLKFPASIIVIFIVSPLSVQMFGASFTNSGAFSHCLRCDLPSKQSPAVPVDSSGNYLANYDVTAYSEATCI
ncbi:hypothetical protein PR003_g14006 [Phytophthora rubi]|uniref:Pectate lyase n=1 Tax=Phytophthora rubi TaxID=129364 RepID=A0A6A3MHV0_9STRA|nr:hypothetical protein PR002_g13348 [Phytophthora rubi]KAE9032124.1 hypothetical protein PR001_g10757 [Phytophthora rubi]KAE9333471.1 hypothetical protein PR003_g14006 [Phytophthora rubi]